MSLLDMPVLQRMSLITMQWCAILIGLSVPISVALDNLLLAVLLLGIVSNAHAVWRIATQHPVARAAWLLFGALLFAVCYGATPWREAVDTLGKYIDLVFVPLFMLLLSSEPAKRWAQYAFLAAMGLTLFVSYLVGLKILTVTHLEWLKLHHLINDMVTNDDPSIFHSYITQSNMMAFAVLLVLINLREATSMFMRSAWGLFAFLGTANVLFMMQGRTGYLILMVSLVWFAWATSARYLQKRGKKWARWQGAVVVLVILGLVAIAYQAVPRLHDRMSLAISEFQAWQPNHAEENESIKLRLDFYYNTLQIVKQSPVFGVGTGGFHDAFAQQTQGTSAIQTRNPHNEYLMITVQIGLVGLALMLYLFYTQWRCARLLETSLEQDAARGLVLAYLVNCAFNSALMDHADGLFFAFMTAALFAGQTRDTQHA